jgi:lipoyl-dependent peroxiredoxin subunit D
MSLTEFAAGLPIFARDIRVNLEALLDESTLDDQRKYGTMLACAHVTGHRPLIRATEDEVADKLTPEAANAARSAASVMTMNNVYYRFVHLASNKEYGGMPVKLRMNAIGCPGIDKADFEMFSLAVSAINGCGMCIDAHEQVLKRARVSAGEIQAAVRIAAVMQAAAAADRSRVEVRAWEDQPVTA